MAKESVFDRLNDRSTYTGVYAERFRSGPGINADDKDTSRAFRGFPTEKTDHIVKDSSELMRPNLRGRHAEPPAPTDGPGLHPSVIDLGDGGPPRPVDTNSQLMLVFQYYCRFGRTGGRNVSEDTIDNVNFAKFSRECPGLLGKRVDKTEIDLVFTRAKDKKGRRLNYEQFLDALSMIAAKRYHKLDPASGFSLLLARHVFKCPASVPVATAEEIKAAEGGVPDDVYGDYAAAAASGAEPVGSVWSPEAAPPAAPAPAPAAPAPAPAPPAPAAPAPPAAPAAPPAPAVSEAYAAPTAPAAPAYAQEPAAYDEAAAFRGAPPAPPAPPRHSHPGAPAAAPAAYAPAWPPTSAGYGAAEPTPAGPPAHYGYDPRYGVAPGGYSTSPSGGAESAYYGAGAPAAAHAPAPVPAGAGGYYGTAPTYSDPYAAAGGHPGAHARAPAPASPWRHPAAPGPAPAPTAPGPYGHPAPGGYYAGAPGGGYADAAAGPYGGPPVASAPGYAAPYGAPAPVHHYGPAGAGAAAAPAAPPLPAPHARGSVHHPEGSYDIGAYYDVEHHHSSPGPRHHTAGARTSSGSDYVPPGATKAGQANKRGGVFDRLSNPSSFTGVYRRAYHTDGRINAHSDDGVKELSRELRPALRQEPGKHKPFR